MTAALKIDFVSDVSCPWCAIGLKALEQAITNLGDGIDVELHFLEPAIPNVADDADDLTPRTSRGSGCALRVQCADQA